MTRNTLERLLLLAQDAVNVHREYAIELQQAAAMLTAENAPSWTKPVTGAYWRYERAMLYCSARQETERWCAADTVLRELRSFCEASA